MKWSIVLAAAFAAWPSSILVAAAPWGPHGPCEDYKVDLILKGDMDASECCSYGRCKGDVVVSVG